MTQGSLVSTRLISSLIRGLVALGGSGSSGRFGRAMRGRLGRCKSLRAVAYGCDEVYQKACVLIGQPARSGKGTIGRLLKGLLGRTSYAAVSLRTLGTDLEWST